MANGQPHQQETRIEGILSLPLKDEGKSSGGECGQRRLTTLYVAASASLITRPEPALILSVQTSLVARFFVSSTPALDVLLAAVLDSQ